VSVRERARERERVSVCEESEAAARHCTVEENGAPTRSLALREVGEIIDIGERPFWRVVSHRSSARDVHTYTRNRRPFVFKVSEEHADDGARPLATPACHCSRRPGVSSH